MLTPKLLSMLRANWPAGREQLTEPGGRRSFGASRSSRRTVRWRGAMAAPSGICVIRASRSPVVTRNDAEFRRVPELDVRSY
jgi:hypothetical protein